jgi:hypothetical protein
VGALPVLRTENLLGQGCGLAQMPGQNVIDFLRTLVGRADATTGLARRC